MFQPLLKGTKMQKRQCAFILSLIWSLTVCATAPMLVNGRVERPIAIVTVGFCNAYYYKWNLDSIFSQNYTNYRLIYTDDDSVDGTPLLVQKYIKEKRQSARTTLILNHKRCGAMANIYKAVMSCDDNEIVLIVDADDALAHSGVLTRINQEYSDPNVWITYGQYQEHPSGARGFCCPMPEDVIKQNAYRKYPHLPSHLRTFYAKLFKNIKLEDLMCDGEFVKMSCDSATMLPMMEMAGGRFKFIPDVLYLYNARNPLSDHRISQELQFKINALIRSRTPYEKLESLF